MKREKRILALLEETLKESFRFKITRQDILDIEKRAATVSERVSDVLPENIREWLLFEKQVQEYIAYCEVLKNSREERDALVNEIGSRRAMFFKSIAKKVCDPYPFKHSLAEVVDEYNDGHVLTSYNREIDEVFGDTIIKLKNIGLTVTRLISKDRRTDLLNKTNDEAQRVRESLRIDSNVILIDWSVMADDLYSKAQKELSQLRPHSVMTLEKPSSQLLRILCRYSYVERLYSPKVFDITGKKFSLVRPLWINKVRITGKTYVKNLEVGEVIIPRVSLNLDSLVNYVKEKFPTAKITVQ
jgi:hypothetical protein